MRIMVDCINRSTKAARQRGEELRAEGKLGERCDLTQPCLKIVKIGWM